VTYPRSAGSRPKLQRRSRRARRCTPAGPPGPTGAGGAAGSTGSQGPAGANGNGVLSGGGPPSAALGANGDFYRDTSANTLYGPKSGAGWGSPVSLVGPQGTQGATGSTGPAGPPGPTASAFSQGSTSLAANDSTTPVVSFTIAPAFANCQAFVDGSPIGVGSAATVNPAATAEVLSVTAAAAVTAGTHTVSIECSTPYGGTTPSVSLAAFALVAAS
jgi:hypothetical protein